MNILIQSIEDFPRSFRLLQQEALLCRSCITTGFEYLLKGRTIGDLKGSYYASFFQISIGIERMMKLIYISHHMRLGDYAAIDEKHLKRLGHNLNTLFTKSCEIAKIYDNDCFGFAEVTKFELSILDFFDSFATGAGRYYNISNINTTNSEDPIVKWDAIIKEIARLNFSERQWKSFETTAGNVGNELLSRGISFPIPEYLDGVFADLVDGKANHYAVWHIINLIKPLAETLDGISMSLHKDNTERDNTVPYPSFPYFDEFFKFCYYTKKGILSNNKWFE